MGEHRCNFQMLFRLVTEELSKIPALRKTPRTKQCQFSMDVCLIACGVRCAYLVDAVTPLDPVHTFSSLLQNLRDKVCSL
ncbi:hypothetical protein V8B97DRAFT_1107967 [Scleroderma yunnanense]